MQQSLGGLSTHHSSIEYKAPTVNFQTLVEHPHLLEIYYYIFYHTFSKEENASGHHIDSGSFQISK